MTLSEVGTGLYHCHIWMLILIQGFKMGFQAILQVEVRFSLNIEMKTGIPTAKKVNAAVQLSFPDEYRCAESVLPNPLRILSTSEYKAKRAWGRRICDMSSSGGTLVASWLARTDIIIFDKAGGSRRRMESLLGCSLVLGWQKSLETLARDF
ncbi:hypothetical protein MPER_05469 [Moniliophthora perniciosa FA553]|nr:hypothetical protein MPER_05469 [Moniliophthora perniciosa FA553]